jgi:predicted transcriptional regulator
VSGGRAADILRVVNVPPFSGELQAQVMATIWRIDGGGVEDVRRALPKRYQSAYTTIQTVLNRLAERGLLDRDQVGRTIRYTPRISEADYVRQSIEQTLASASRDARTAALVQLIGDLDDQLGDLQQLAAEAAARKRRA